MIPEFPRPIKVDDIPNAGRVWQLDATAEECQALAQRFRIIAVSNLTAQVKLKPQSHGDVIRVTGRVQAQVVQACVVTLAPVTQQVSEDFDLTFAHVETPDDPLAELEIDLSVEDPPDAIVDGCIDVGEICAEHLALGLDPFPRADGAEFHFDSETSDDSVPEMPSPFAVLANLKHKKI